MSYIDCTRYEYFTLFTPSVLTLPLPVSFFSLGHPTHHRTSREEDIQKMLSAQVHIGTRNSDSQMKDYIWRRRQVSSSLNCYSVQQYIFERLFGGTTYLEVMWDSFCHKCGEKPLKFV